MGQVYRYILKGILVFAVMFAIQQMLQAQNAINLQFIGRYSTGVFDAGGMEILAYDAPSKRLYGVNASTGRIEIINLTNPFSPVLITTIDLSPYGSAANSIAIKNGILAAAVEANPKQNPGKVVFFNSSTGAYINDVTVGALPDMLCFTPDGTKVLTANEGEPKDDYTIDPEGSVSIVDISAGVANATVQTAGFTSFNGASLPNIRLKTTGGTTVAQDLEPEYITISTDSKTAWVTLQENNAIAIIDIATATVLDLKGLGYKDYTTGVNKLDASDQNSGLINITNQPVKGMYMPDGIASVRYNGQTYLLTANEGDAREYSGYTDVIRVGNAGYLLDPTTFSNAATLKNNNNIGRLNVTNKWGDTDNDGDFDVIYTFGGRSFSIWDSTATQIYDSKDDFEQITASIYFNNFNASNTNNTKKNRSDDKGPEPEGIITAVIGDSTYAFIGLERMSGIMVYNVTNPFSPRFIQYIDSRNLTQTPALGQGGDLGPEGLLFIPKAQSPNGRDLLVVGNETSGTAAVFQINIGLTVNSTVDADTFRLNTSALIGTYSGINLFEGGFSGLNYVAGSNNEFEVTTDRGPNADASSSPFAGGSTALVFPFPSYAPKMYRIKAESDTIQILNSMTWKRPTGANASGLPNPAGLGGTGELAWSDVNATTIAPDTFGMDPEGIKDGLNNDYWVCEEYGATVWQVNKTTGELINRYSPYGNAANQIAIDSIIKMRVANRGFEGVARTPNGKVYAILQSPLANPNSAASDASRLHRLVEIDPSTGTVNMYAYEHDAPLGGTSGLRNRDFKIGDLVAVNNAEFLVIEHGERNGFNQKNIYKINIGGATPIPQGLITGGTFEQLNNASTAIANGITPVTKTLVLDLLENNWDTNLDKPEGLTIIDNTTIAVVNDNDYGINSPNTDGALVATGKPTKLFIYHLPASLALNTCSNTASISASGPTTICADESLTLTASGTANYQWRLNGNAINAATGTTYQPTASGKYSVLTNAGNAICATLSPDVNITVNPLPDSTVTLNGPATFCQGGSVTLSSTQASGVSYEWLLNNNSIGSTQQTYVANAAGDYNLRITSTASGCDNLSADVTVVVNANPDATFTVNDSIVCAGENVTLTAASTGAFTYEWRRNNVAIVNSNSSPFNITTSGAYRLFITNNATTCTTLSGISNVVVNALPVAAIQPTATVLCQGENANLVSGVAGNYTYNWSANGNTLNTGNAFYINVDSAAVYGLEITNNATGCVNTATPVTITVNALPDAGVTTTPLTICSDIDVTLSANTASGLNYQWVMDGNINVTTASVLTTNQSGTYQLSVTDPNTGCENQSTPFTVLVNPTPNAVIIAPAVTEVCNGDSVRLYTPVTGYNYQWWNNGNQMANETTDELIATTNGNYSIQLTDANTGCSSESQQVQVTVNYPANVALIPLGGTVCQGDSVELTATAINNVTYVWYNNGVVITGVTGNTYTAYNSGSFTVAVTDTNGCSSTTSAGQVTVNPLPQVPSVIQAGNVLTTEQGYNYEWYFDGNVINGASSFAYQPDTSGAYNVIITDGNGCVNQSATYQFTYIDPSIGINDLQNLNISVFPNPFGNTLNINTGINGTYTITLYDEAGRVCYTSTQVSPNSQIATDKLALGMYIMEVNFNNQKHFLRLVKQ
jgi:hypothetical protein